MKKTLFLLAACLFLLCGCSPSGDPLAYQNSAFEAEIALTIADKEFSAVLLMSERDADGGSARDVSISFTAPENMSGVTVKQSGTSCTLSLGGVEIPMSSSAVSGFFEISDAFSIDGTLEGIETGDGINVLHFSSGRGNYTVFLDTASSLPKRIEAETGGRTIDIDIKKFTKK